MAYAADSKQATAELVNPFVEPEPAHETGPGAHFGSTFAGMPEAKTGSTASHARSSSNPYRNSSQGKSGVSATANPVGHSTPPRHSSGSPRFRDSPGRSSPPTKFPEYRDAVPTHRTRRSSEIPPPSYEAVAGPSSGRRRTSSLAQRYPGDESHKPLDIIRRDSRKAGKPHHLKKRSMQGPDIIDRLDPAIGGRPYHHEGPYDAASMARNRDPKHAPVAALETTNSEAIRATPRENVKDALEKHMPLDGTAAVPPGQPDRLGRTYDYEEGSDMMREGFNGEPGYKQWSGKDYDSDDLKGQGDSFGLDRALQAHRIDDEGGIEMQDSAALRKDYKRQERQGMLDKRDPTAIAGDDGRYADIQAANDTDLHRKSSLRAAGSSLKKRIGSIRRKDRDD